MHTWTCYGQRITKKGTIGFLSLNCIWYIHFLLTFMKLEILPFLPDLHYKLLKIVSHDPMDTVIEVHGQSWPGNMCRMAYLWLNWGHSELASGRQLPTCEHVTNVDIFYFDPPCDVIGDPEVNKIKFCSTTLAGLFNGVSILKIDPKYAEVVARKSKKRE